MTGSGLRVTLLAPLPPPMGGITRWTSRFIARAPEHGLAVDVINNAPAAADRTEGSRLRADRAQQALRVLANLERNLAHWRPDVVHVTTNLHWATLRDGAAVMQAQRRGVPAVLNIRGSNQMITWRDGLARPARAAVDGLLRHAAAVVVLSTELETYLRRALPTARIERIANMVEPSLPAPAPVLPPRSRPIRVLFVGWSMPGKGVGELARAVLALPDVELVCIGGAAAANDAAVESAMRHDLKLLHDASTGRLEHSRPVANGAGPPARGQKRKLAPGGIGAFNGRNSRWFWWLTGGGSRAHCSVAVLPEGLVAGF